MRRLRGKPYLLMRKKGVYGTRFGKHVGIPGLSKSIGGAIERGVVVTNIIDLDGDGLPDTLLSGTPGQGTPVIYEDADSINIDLDGDGVIDQIIPK